MVKKKMSVTTLSPCSWLFPLFRIQWYSKLHIARKLI